MKNFIKEKFPRAKICIPPNVTRADEDDPNPNPRKKRVLNQEEADIQETVSERVNLIILLTYIILLTKSDH